MDSLYELGYSLLYNNPDSAIQIGTEYLELAIESGDSFEIAYAHNLKGSGLYYKNQLEASLKHHLAAEKILKDLDYEYDYEMSTALSGIGGVYSDQGYYLRAADYYLQSLKLDIRLGDIEGQVYLLNSIALLFYDQEDFKKAEEYVRQSMDLHEGKEPKGLISSNYNLLAELETKKGNILEANILSQQAIDIALKENDLLELAYANFNFGMIEIAKKNQKKGIDYLKKAVSLAKKFGDPYSEAMYLNYLANACLKANNPDMALLQAKEAYRLIKTSSASRYLYRESHLVLSKIYAFKKDFKKSLDHYQTYKSISDTMLNLNISEKLLLQENKLKSEENKSLNAINEVQQDVIERNYYLIIGSLLLVTIGLGFIILLAINIKKKKRFSNQLIEKNAIIQANQDEIDSQSNQLIDKNIKLNELINTRDKLFSILTHDIKQPFNQILSVLELMSYNALSKEEEEEMVRLLKTSVINTKESVENLLVWSKSQFTGITAEPKKVNVRKLAEEFKCSLSATLKTKSIDLKIDMPKEVLVNVDPHQLEIILKNLLVNAVKFSHPEGVINLYSEEVDNDQIKISIQDYGVGIEDERLAQFKDFNSMISTDGTFNEKGTGLGILIVNEFILQNHGAFNIESTLGKGSTFIITLPKTSA